jgi:hypothetical protein
MDQRISATECGSIRDDETHFGGLFCGILRGESETAADQHRREAGCEGAAELALGDVEDQALRYVCFRHFRNY